jgi:hypothetical protein
VHSEKGPGNPKTPDFIPIGYGVKDVTFHNVITEWHATNPRRTRFEGTRREILREYSCVANLTTDGAVNSADSEAGRRRLWAPLPAAAITASEWRRTELQQSRSNSAPDTIMTAILRIDHAVPRSHAWREELGDPSIPMANKFAADNDPDDSGEISPMASVTRTASHGTWPTERCSPPTSDGQHREINIVRNGENYGWMKREGYFQNGLRSAAR